LQRRHIDVRGGSAQLVRRQQDTALEDELIAVR
jgi:hypothetical protein